MHGGAVVGLLTRNLLVRAVISQGPEAYVAGAMDRDFVRVPPDMDLSEAFPKIGRSCALVMDEDQAVRANRLRLLLDVRDTLGRLGDFSQLQR